MVKSQAMQPSATCTLFSFLYITECECGPSKGEDLTKGELLAKLYQPNKHPI